MNPCFSGSAQAMLAIAGWRLRPTRIDEIAAPNRAPWPGHLKRSE
jgi:hypothetical protein